MSSKALVTHFAQQLGAGLAPMGHAAAKFGESFDGVLGFFDWRDARYGLPPARDDDFFSCFHLIKQVAEMRLGFCQRHGTHAILLLVILLVI
jgi:hypothetical protein